MWQRRSSYYRTRPIKFFRKSLIGLTASQVEEYLVRLEKEAKDFKTELVRLSWYMRGGVTVDQLLHQYSHDDRSAMYTVVKENIELSKETNMPLV
jgi:hypothetical protein